MCFFFILRRARASVYNSSGVVFEVFELSFGAAAAAAAATRLEIEIIYCMEREMDGEGNSK